jgi:hypothetical protein
MIQSVAKEDIYVAWDSVAKIIVKASQTEYEAKSNLTIFMGYAVKLAKFTITRNRDLKHFKKLNI